MEISSKDKKRNADYPKESIFSELHTYYSEYSNVVGFGDFSITGEEYSESGGPAYVVTTSMSYINNEKFDELYIRHYSSEPDGTPQTQEKILEALSHFMNAYNTNEVNFIETEGIRQFISLHKARHFPGLGQVKKISILHHTETINYYLLIMRFKCQSFVAKTVSMTIIFHRSFLIQWTLKDLAIIVAYNTPRKLGPKIIANKIE